jgi:hypothetical protein
VEIEKQLRQELLDKAKTIRIETACTKRVLEQRNEITDQMITQLAKLNISKIKEKTGSLGDCANLEISEEPCAFRKQILKMFRLVCGHFVHSDRELTQNERALYWQSNPELFQVKP